jgi:hypothetical protein
MFCASNNGFSIWSINDGYVVGPGEVLFAEWPTPAQLDAAFPGYLLTVAKTNVLNALQSAYYTARTANFTSDATGTTLAYSGDSDSEDTLTRNVVDSILNASNQSWIGHYSTVDASGNVSLIPLSASQIQAVFSACQSKHLAADSNYITKVSAVNAVTDITSVGVAAVNAITW